MKGVPFFELTGILTCIAVIGSAPPLGILTTIIFTGVALGRRNTKVQRFLLADTPRNGLINYLLPPAEISIETPVAVEKARQEALYMSMNQEAETASYTLDEPTAQSILSLQQWLPIVNDKFDDAPHTLIIGDTGSGKTTLAQAILSNRSGQFIIADPKPKPGKWGNLPFVSVDDEGECTPIDTLFKEVLQEIKIRLNQMKEGKEDFTSLTVVVDEWPFVKGECSETAPLLLKRLGSIGRELRVRLIALTQSDRVKSLGIEGEGDARGNFTIVRLGKPAVAVQPLTRSMERPACLEWRGEYLPILTNGVVELSKRNINQDRLWITEKVATLFNANVKDTLYSGNTHGSYVPVLRHSEQSTEQSRLQSAIPEYDLLAALQEKYTIDRDTLVRTLLRSGYTHVAIRDELKKAGMKIDNNRLGDLSKEVKGEQKV